VIEDAITGVEAARQAGMKCIAVTTTNTASSLQAANMVVDQLDELSVGDLISLFTES
jgi:beta-phosphoglucomutase-like phosphatase (HAD superfamily)